MTHPGALEVSNASITAAAGFLAGAMDQHAGTGTQWAMMVYAEILRAGNISIEYLYRLERTIKKRWPEAPCAQDFLNGPWYRREELDPES